MYILYVLFIFVQPSADHESWRQWSLAGASVLVFLFLYAGAFLVRGRIGLLSIALMVVLGFAYAPVNGGASCFLIFAGAFFGFYFAPAVACSLLAGLIAADSLESWLLHLNSWFWGSSVAMIAIVGLGNVYAAKEKRSTAKLRLAHEEIERLAKVAERERIARDLHDVLGHTLSVIVLKSELASKLIEQNMDRARAEISEVEQIARDALAEVRHAIRGYRAGSLAEEFARARSTLETAGIRAEFETRQARASVPKLSAAQETVLALVVREAITNVVRHSSAGICRILLEQDARHYRIQIEDDGRGGAAEEGNGLRGMRERVEALYGNMTRESSRGTRLTITIPTNAQEATA